jgi:hypothetical protein
VTKKPPIDDEAAKRLVDMGFFATNKQRRSAAPAHPTWERARKLAMAQDRVAITVDTPHGRRRLYTFAIHNPGDDDAGTRRWILSPPLTSGEKESGPAA